ncbi:unnamed protein product [Periconia digitata]|uniref:Uncharacterized protein n=1 Tax=Periconia digitata TaxID=1303443 RepID=A0A9W4XPH2_9PLEO|nr:unnamed protein product [Periconia digitata]
MPNYTFIATDERGVVKKDDNKLIRSSCMRGKNERHDSRRVKRRTKRYASQSTEPQTSANGTQAEDQDGSVDVVDIPATNTLGAILAARVIGTPLTEAHVSDASLYSFINKVDRPSRDIMFKYLTFSVSIDLLYPVGKCLKYPPIDNFMVLMMKNPPLLELTLLITHSIHDFVLQRSPSVLTITHLRKTLAHLNALITQHPSEENIFIIVFLALGLGNMAAMFGDYSATSAHIQGLQRIATIKGGKEHLERFPKFNFKISRYVLYLPKLPAKATIPICDPSAPVKTTPATTN